jgi:DNA-binding NarL/FixJ family response regulator
MDSLPAPARVMVLDGNAAFVAAAGRRIDRMPGFSRVLADVVLVDLGLAGLDLARRVKLGNPLTVVIALALFPSAELAAEAERLGLDGVVSKESFAEDLQAVLARAGVEQ